MQALRQLIISIRPRAAYIAVIVFALSNQLIVAGYSVRPALGAASAPHVSGLVCGSHRACATAEASGDRVSSLSLPVGMEPCADSGGAAACNVARLATDSQPGASTLPQGAIACATVDSKPLPAALPAACLEPGGTNPAPQSALSSAAPTVQPSVPISSLGDRWPTLLTLKADSTTVNVGKRVVLTAEANATVTGSAAAIEIFDATANTLAGACALGSRCSVAYSAASGFRSFIAFVTRPTSQIPTTDVALASDPVSVGWLGSTISASRTVAGPTQSVTVTASSTLDVRGTGRWLEIYDLTDGKRLTYCTSGNVCTTSMKETAGGAHELVGYVTGKPEAVSSPLYVTWLAVSLSATSIGPKTGGTIYLRATANADLTNTPWVIGIYDEHGRLVDHVCKAGTTCNVRAWMNGGTTPTYTAVIGALPTDSSTPGRKIVRAAIGDGTPDLVDVQARSQPVQPTHLLWGVDSCKAMTGDPSGEELFPNVVSALGTPEFWGRYLTNTICPGISRAEVALAGRYHIGILPIYNDYDCSNVSYYATGHAYAVDAVAAAKAIGIPKGKLLAIDIEPYGAACPGAASVDSGFIEGWYDGVQQAGYIPGFYGNGTSGSEFASAWCATVSTLPNVGQGSDLWSFEPSLLGGFSKTNAPNFSPYDPGCAGNMLAWQYELGSNSSYASVDHDEAISSLPLWYPS